MAYSNGQSISLNDEDYLKLSGNRISSELKEVKSRINAEINRAENQVRKILDKNPPFEFSKFEELNSLKKDVQFVKDVFDLVISEKWKTNKLGTASSYNDALQALNRFCDSDGLTFTNLNSSFLKRYENHLLELEKKAINTVGVYMRSLKVIYNRAIDLNIVSRDHYPFATRSTGTGYHIPKQATRKRALTKEDIQKIFFDYQPVEASSLWKAKQYFMFSYLCNGMNFADLVELKKKDFDGEWIRYYRKKTKDTATDKKQIQIHVTSHIRAILESLKDRSSNCPFLFPIIDEKMTEPKRRETRQQFIKTTNKNLKRIAKDLELSIEDISTYFARHSWATIQKRNGTSLELISDSLGHHTTQMTQVYLDSFDEDTLRGLNDNLL